MVPFDGGIALPFEVLTKWELGYELFTKELVRYYQKEEKFVPPHGMGTICTMGTPSCRFILLAGFYVSQYEPCPPQGPILFTSRLTRPPIIVALCIVQREYADHGPETIRLPVNVANPVGILDPALLPTSGRSSTEGSSDPDTPPSRA